MPVLKELDGSHGLDLHPMTDAEISNSQVAATLGLALANVLERISRWRTARRLRELCAIMTQSQRSSTYAGILLFDCLCGHQQLVFFVRAI